MNQNSNYNFDPTTGQPVNQSQPSTQNFNMNTGYTQPPMQKPKKNNKLMIVIVILLIIGVVATVLYFNNQNNNDGNLNNNSNNNGSVENNNSENTDNTNTPSDEDINTDSIGKVDEGTNTTYDETGAFLLRIEDVFTVTGRGTMVTGIVERGKVKPRDIVQIVGLSDEILTAEVSGVEMFRQENEEATIGDNAGIVLKDIERTQVKKGQALAQPNSIVAAKKFDADVYLLSTDEGGRQTSFSESFKPQFYFKTVDITGIIDLPANIEMVMPGDNVSFTVTLESNVAMEVGTTFTIRENKSVIGSGVVTKVY